MTFEIFGCEIYVSVPFAAFIAMLFLLDRTGLMSLSLAGVLIHEAGHIIAMKAIKVMPIRIELKPAVVHIIKPKRIISYKDDIKVSLAGPAASAAAAIISAAVYFLFYKEDIMLWMTVVNSVLALFNLLPISELDGGKVLGNLLMLRFAAPDARKITTVISYFFVTLVIASGAALLWAGYKNATLLLTGIYMLILMLLKLKS